MALAIANLANNAIIPEGWVDAVTYGYNYGPTADRPAASAAVKGMMYHDTTLGVITTCNGTAWSTIGPPYGALTSWTPVVTQGATPSFTVDVAHCTRTGRWVQGYAHLTFTATPGTANTAIQISLPYNMATTGNVIGSGMWWDSSLGVPYQFFPYTVTSNICQMLQTTPSTTYYLGVTGSSDGAALSVNDVVSYTFAYEVAADA